MDNVFDELRNSINQMEKDYRSWKENNNKSAGKRLRVACSAMAKFLKGFRAKVLEESRSTGK